MNILKNACCAPYPNKTIYKNTVGVLVWLFKKTSYKTLISFTLALANVCSVD